MAVGTLEDRVRLAADSGRRSRRVPFRAAADADAADGGLLELEVEALSGTL